MQYCSLQHRTLLLSPVTSTAGYCFALTPSLHSFRSYFSTDLQQHIGHLSTWGVPLSVSYHFSFLYCSLGSQGKNIEVVCHSLLQWATFCQTSPPWTAHLGWPHRAWLSFTELDKAVVLGRRVSWAAQSCPTLCDPMDCSLLAPLSMGFSRQEYWSGLPFPFPGDLPHPGIKPESPTLQADSLPSEQPGKSSMS